MFETETAGPCLIWKMKGGGHDPLTPPQVATPLHMCMSYYKA